MIKLEEKLQGMDVKNIKKFNNIEVTKYILAKLGLVILKIIGFKYYENTNFILPLSK